MFNTFRPMPIQILMSSHPNLALSGCFLWGGAIYLVETLTCSMVCFSACSDFFAHCPRCHVTAVNHWYRDGVNTGNAAFLAIWTILHAIFLITLAALTSKTTFRHQISSKKSDSTSNRGPRQFPALSWHLCSTQAPKIAEVSELYVVLWQKKKVEQKNQCFL